jgi:hypothetical protein
MAGLDRQGHHWQDICDLLPHYGFRNQRFEHSVANMYFIPMGITIVNKAPELAIAAGFDRHYSPMGTLS